MKIEEKMNERQQEAMKILVESGVFSIRNGYATLLFDSEGTLTEVDIHIKNYKRGKPVIHRIDRMNSLTRQEDV